MTNLLLSANVVLPLFLLMALGYILKLTGLLDGGVLKKMNATVFKVFLPALIIYNVYTSDISEVFDVKLLAYSIACVVGSFLFLMLFIPILEKNNRKRGVIIQGIFRSNFVIFGVPVCLSLYNNEIPGKVAVLIAVIVPIFNFLSVIALETFRSESDTAEKSSKKKEIIKGIITNPLIISSAIGLLILFSGIKLPLVIEETLSDVAGIATPLALIILGASMNFSSVSSNMHHLIIVLSGKLIVLPAIFLSIAILMGFRSVDLAILLTLFASPTAVSSFTMAQQMDADDELAGQIVVLGTCLCLITMFLWLFILKQIALI